jgi:hypothetical protein
MTRNLEELPNRSFQNTMDNSDTSKHENQEKYDKDNIIIKKDDSEKNRIKNNSNNKIKKTITLNKERNIVKKVKTFCLNKYFIAIQSCINNPKIFSFYNIKNKKNRKIFRTFKSDISKTRNHTLLDISMKTILENFGHLDWQKVKIKQENINTFNFLKNMTWGELIKLIKNKNEIFYEKLENKFMDHYIKKLKVVEKDFIVYFQYIKDIDYSYGNRVNVEQSYLRIYELIIEEGINFHMNLDLVPKDIFQILEEFDISLDYLNSTK